MNQQTHRPVVVELDPAIPGRINLRNVRIAYAEGLNTARVIGNAANSNGKPQEPRFSSVFLIPESEQQALATIREGLWRVAVGKWADRAGGVWQALEAGNRLALRDGRTKADQDGFAGHWFISANSKEGNPPLLLSQYVNSDGQLIQLPRPQNVIFSGCFVNVQIDAWAQDNQDGGKRINAELKIVQFAFEGDRFGGGASADASVFAQGAQQAPAGFNPMGGGQPPGGYGAAPQQPGGVPPVGAAAPAQGGMPPGFNPPGYGGAPAPQQPQTGFNPAPQQPQTGFNPAAGQVPGGYGAAPQPPQQPGGMPPGFNPQMPPAGAPWTPPGM